MTPPFRKQGFYSTTTLLSPLKMAECHQQKLPRCILMYKPSAYSCLFRQLFMSFPVGKESGKPQNASTLTTYHTPYILFYLLVPRADWGRLAHGPADQRNDTTSCYLYLYSIFSLQLASTHSFHSDGLGGIEDWKWHTGCSVSLSLFTLGVWMVAAAALVVAANGSKVTVWGQPVLGASGPQQWGVGWQTCKTQQECSDGPLVQPCMFPPPSTTPNIICKLYRWNFFLAVFLSCSFCMV